VPAQQRAEARRPLSAQRIPPWRPPLRQAWRSPTEASAAHHGRRTGQQHAGRRDTESPHPGTPGARQQPSCATLNTPDHSAPYPNRHRGSPRTMETLARLNLFRP
jgi:hypothetical protein